MTILAERKISVFLSGLFVFVLAFAMVQILAQFFSVRGITRLHSVSVTLSRSELLALFRKSPPFTSADLNHNSVEEEYSVANGVLTITEGAISLWMSPVEWHIDTMQIADANNDGQLDINLSVWKAGNFGTSRPFWVTKEDTSIRNHFFVFDLLGNTIQAIWQSSNLERPNCDFRVVDVDRNGQQELVVLEGVYDREYECQPRDLAVWEWNGWGFSNEERFSVSYDALQ